MGKGQGRVTVRSPSPITDPESLSEAVEVFEESSDSESDFVASDEAEVILNSGDDSEDEALMLSAAIELSREAARLTNATASSSRTTLVSADPVAVVRAVAAERRRLARAKKNQDADDEEILEYKDVDDFSEDSASESEEEPLVKKQKRKGATKGKTAKGDKIVDTSHPPPFLQQRKAMAAQRKQVRAERKEAKAQELALSRKLGRALTYVSPTPYLFVAGCSNAVQG